MILRRLREMLFGSRVSHGGTARSFGKGMLQELETQGLCSLSDEDLISLVEYLLTHKELRRPLRGNARFLQSVAAQYRRRGNVTAKQRQGVLNVLERAYPHSLAAELMRSL